MTDAEARTVLAQIALDLRAYLSPDATFGELYLMYRHMGLSVQMAWTQADRRITTAKNPLVYRTELKEPKSS